MPSSEYEETLVESLNELLSNNNPKTARRILEQAKDTFSQYQEFDMKLRKLETKHG